MLSLPTAASTPRPSAIQRKILIGIDLGTTFSAIGWVQTGDPRDLNIIREWPEVALTDEKAPTILSYSNGYVKWGFQASDDEERREWFKLGLYSEMEVSPLARNYPSTTAQPRLYGSDQCENLIVDYLRSLRQHAKRIIEGKYGSLVTTIPTEYIITVPAIWNEKAQNTTRSCAARAGMGHKDSIHIVTEPEAAGIYALKKMAGIKLEVDDTFVVCDAGGGTVDLIAYTVASLGNVPRISEASQGSGRLCGSVFLNRIFDHWLKRRFDVYPYWDDQYHAAAMEKWDTDLKKNFMGDVSKNYIIHLRGLPDNPRLGIRNGRLTITGEEMRDIFFEPVIGEILQLVHDQIARVKREGEREGRREEKRVKAVMLAGGFGTNGYLKRRIQEEVGQATDVFMIDDCNTAIVRGALVKGVAEMEPALASIRLHSRMARKHYGTLCYAEYNPRLHDAGRREQDPFKGQYRVPCYRWFVKKGATVQESIPVSFGYFYEKPTREGPPGLLNIVVYVCEDPEGRGAPVHEDTGRVTELVKLNTDLSQILSGPIDKECGKDGLEHYRVDFDIEMILRSANLSFNLVYKGRKYHTVQAEFV